MSSSALKTIRFFVPGVFSYVLFVLFCWASNWCTLALPESYETLTKSLLALALAAVYYALPLRKNANRIYFDRVNQNLVDELTRPFNSDVDFPKNLRWPKISRIFYNYIDTDPRLAHTKGLAFWNGAFWTSTADLRVISGLGVLLFAGAILIANLIHDSSFNNSRAIGGLLLLIFLFVISILFSELTTRLHMAIGSQQAEYIRENHRAELKAKLIQASASQ